MADLIRKSDVLEAYADLYDIFDDNKAIQEELHKVFDKINDIPTVEPNSSEKPNNCETCKHYNPDHEAIACERCLDGKYDRYEPKTEPQVIACPLQEEDAEYARWLYEDEPQTDCAWGKGE